MKKLIGSMLIIYAAMQSMPFYISNIFVYVGVFVLTMLFILSLGYPVPKKNYFISFLLLWLFYGLISYLWSVNSFLWFRNNVILLLILLSTLIFIYVVDSKENIIFFSKIWALTIGMANIVGWYEIIFNNYHFTVSQYTSYYANLNWPLFTFLNVNDYSTYLTISIPIVFLWIKNETKILNKIFGYVLIISTLIIQILIVSRANLLAVIIGFIFLYLISHVKLTLTNSLSYILIFLIIFGGIIFTYSNGYIDKVFLKFVHNEVRSDSLRMDLIKNGLVYLKNSKYLGVGAGNIEYWLDNVRYYNTAGMVYIHNWWVEVLVNFGIVIFIGYIIFWLRILFININLVLSYKDRITQYLTMAVIVFSLAVISPSTILLMKWLPVFTGFIVASTLYSDKNIDMNNE